MSRQAEFWRRNAERLNAQRNEWYEATTRLETYVVSHDYEVVYVGKTNNWRARLHGHRAGSPWWVEPSGYPVDDQPVVQIEHRYHESIREQRFDEAKLIYLHQPRYNKDGVTR